MWDTGINRKCIVPFVVSKFWILWVYTNKIKLILLCVHVLNRTE
jgi:hypothetical protein